MVTIRSFAVRSNGRNLREVRRPKPVVDLATLKKADLSAIAEAKGLDAKGTKADILSRLAPESNDADVEPADD